MPEKDMAGSDGAVLAEAKDAKPGKKPASRAGPKWEAEARDRLRAGLRRFSKPLADLAARDANEGDTRLLVTDFLCDALGFDKYADLTTEYQVKGEFADYGVRIDRELIAFIEVKRIATKLAPKHLRQVEMYAVNEGVEWVLLTNGAVWQVYHLTGGLPVVIDLALDVNLLGEQSAGQTVNQLFYLTRESLKRRHVSVETRRHTPAPVRCRTSAGLASFREQCRSSSPSRTGSPRRRTRGGDCDVPPGPYQGLAGSLPATNCDLPRGSRACISMEVGRQPMACP